MLPKLKLLRQEYSISQQRLADAVQVSQQSINQYENHKIEPDIAVLSRLADYFDTSIDYIVGRTEVRRRIEPTEAFRLNQAEAEVVTKYRGLNAEERACIQQMLGVLMKK